MHSWSIASITTVTLLALFVPYVAVQALLGALPELIAALADAGTANMLRFAFVTCLLIGYTLAHVLREREAVWTDARALTPLLPEGQPPVPSQLSRTRRWAALAIGAAIGVALVHLTVGDPFFLATTDDFHSRWAVGANGLLFALIVRLLAGNRSLEKWWEEQIVRNLRIDLLEIEVLAPTARRGLRAALYWFVGSTMASLMLFDLQFAPAVFASIAGTLAAGTWALLHPVLSLRHRILNDKQAELLRARSAIREARDGALAGRSEPAARLPGLLAYEARIESVSGWPFDAPTLIRFALFLLLPVGSWLGGALVERGLGALLD